MCLYIYSWLLRDGMQLGLALFIQPDNLCPLIGVDKPFTFNGIFESGRFKYAVLLLVFIRPAHFSFPFFSFPVFFQLHYVLRSHFISTIGPLVISLLFLQAALRFVTYIFTLPRSPSHDIAPLQGRHTNLARINFYFFSFLLCANVGIFYSMYVISPQYIFTIFALHSQTFLKALKFKFFFFLYLPSAFTVSGVLHSFADN